MSTFKKIDQYERTKKLIIILTVGLVIIDTIITFTKNAYIPSSSSLMGVGFSSYHLMKEYVSYRIEHKELSKVILILSLILLVFSLYYILLNLLNMAGVLT